MNLAARMSASAVVGNRSPLKVNRYCIPLIIVVQSTIFFAISILHLSHIADLGYQSILPPAQISSWYAAASCNTDADDTRSLTSILDEFP